MVTGGTTVVVTGGTTIVATGGFAVSIVGGSVLTNVMDTEDPVSVSTEGARVGAGSVEDPSISLSSSFGMDMTAEAFDEKSSSAATRRRASRRTNSLLSPASLAGILANWASAIARLTNDRAENNSI